MGSLVGIELPRSGPLVGGDKNGFIEGDLGWWCCERFFLGSTYPGHLAEGVSR